MDKTTTNQTLEGDLERLQFLYGYFFHVWGR
jgi:hypothetical protein